MQTVLIERAEPRGTTRLEPQPIPESAHIVNQDLFRGALVRERKRADRSDKPLVLVLVGLEDCHAAEPASTWRSVVDALGAVRRETDVLGWFEDQAALGLILPETPALGERFAANLEARVQHELGRRLDARSRNRLSVRILVHPDSKGVVATRSVDPLLAEIHPETSRDIANRTLKRALDILGSASLLLVLAPLFLVIAALVKLTSSGPVFFRQVRVGAKAHPFTMLKFRSMRVNATATVHQEYVTAFITGTGTTAQAASSTVFKLTNDARITPLGRFLRKTSLDELPQLWNVLCGRMSLVGPRPPLQYEVDQYKPWHCRRVLEAKPGITGLWQVTGRSRTTFDDMVRLDLRYARNPTLWNDLKILLATPGAVIAGKGAC
jgi:lipopolysaccharide/colanic/teichoic acid biosynthesis glycosyltransferase